jgi:response regulator RpfG family c-di-GMP phosphodiesterase
MPEPMTQIEKTPEPLLQDEPVRVLVVDDEKVIREILSDFLTMEGLVVRTAENGEVALAELQRNSYNLVVSDLKMPVMGGLELLEQINAHNINVLTVIMTGFGTVETAIEAMKKGAYDYVLKPFKVEEVVHIVKRGLERQRLQLENMRLKEAIGLYKTSAAISQSLSLDHILELVIDAAVEELNADLVSLQLAVPVIADEQPASSPAFVEKLRRGPTTTHGGGVVDLEELVACHRQNMPVLAHGSKTSRFVERSPNDAPLISFCSIPLQVRQQVIGIINAYSFSRGHRFSEGQRKMLAVLGSRAAVSIENAKLYENLLASNCNLEEANRSLEENFRQTIVGFVNALEETDRYTRGHSERVAVYSSMIAQGLGLSAQETDRVTLSAKIHDIGKIGNPSEK